MIEIRDYGDGKTVVVYTDERDMANRLGNLKSCLKIIPYEQEKKGRLALIGVDYYFPKGRLKALLRKSGLPVQRLERLGICR